MKCNGGLDKPPLPLPNHTSVSRFIRRHRVRTYLDAKDLNYRDGSQNIQVPTVPL